ncbi:hypothetical protein F2P81_024390 [Scophthalmus maximus]|uniref:Uncharacterized protein n=1 Tax=Scophthalmus maximus TaxID=52904 RepID=A0A6A4RWR8_SCOMX|nr:hypothetical protein F2P81_024390 [Scophthalmus maximus]
MSNFVKYRQNAVLDSPTFEKNKVRRVHDCANCSGHTCNLVLLLTLWILNLKCLPVLEVTDLVRGPRGKESVNPKKRHQSRGDECLVETLISISDGEGVFECCYTRFHHCEDIADCEERGSTISDLCVPAAPSGLNWLHLHPTHRTDDTAEEDFCMRMWWHETPPLMCIKLRIRLVTRLTAMWRRGTKIWSRKAEENNAARARLLWDGPPSPLHCAIRFNIRITCVSEKKRRLIAADFTKNRRPAPRTATDRVDAARTTGPSLGQGPATTGTLWSADPRESWLSPVGRCRRSHKRPNWAFDSIFSVRLNRNEHNKRKGDARADLRNDQRASTLTSVPPGTPVEVKGRRAKQIPFLRLYTDQAVSAVSFGTEKEASLPPPLFPVVIHTEACSQFREGQVLIQLPDKETGYSER